MKTKGWDSSAVNKAVASVEAHMEFAHALASGSCSVAMKVIFLCFCFFFVCHVRKKGCLQEMPRSFGQVPTVR